MPSPKSAWVPVDLSPSIAVANTNVLVAKPAPMSGIVREVWVGINTALTTGGGVVAVARGSDNLLSATNVDLQSGVTAAAPAKQTLTTNAASKRVAAGDLLKATWTLTTAAITNAASCLVLIEPDTW